MSAGAVIAAARLVRYKTKALREALSAYDDAEATREQDTERKSNCRHANATRVAKSNAGNYDTSADRYWYEYTCPDCATAWTVDQ